ncbi:MAG: hypothetical protein V2A77_02190 [Pseudomonadota bacterium]
MVPSRLAALALAAGLLLRAAPAQAAEMPSPLAVARAGERWLTGHIDFIDPLNRTIRIGCLAAPGGTTLLVTRLTRFISAEGAPEANGMGSLEWGCLVRAAYQREGGRCVATQILLLR